MIPAVLSAAARAREALRADDLQDELCCVYGRSLLRELYDPELVDVVPVARWHLHDGGHPWSPVEAAWDAGLAEAVVLPPHEYTPRPGDVLLCQGWSGLRGGVVVPGVSLGHEFIVVVTTAATVIRIDAAAVATPTKPGRAAPGAEVRWYTWAELRNKYTSGLAVAVLRRPRTVGR